MNKAKMINRIRGVISISLIAVFIIETVTGIALWLAPSGRIARETTWTFAGATKEMLENLHTYIGFAMIALVVIHLAINYKMLLNEVKMLFR